jgi:hypothetical protein
MFIYMFTRKGKEQRKMAQERNGRIREGKTQIHTSVYNTRNVRIHARMHTCREREREKGGEGI